MNPTGSFPTFEARRTDEPAQSFGARALQFLIATDGYGLLDDQALVLADHAAQYAVCSRDISERALDTINRTRHEIAASLRRRRDEQERLALSREVAALGAKLSAARQAKPSNPSGGLRVPVRRSAPMIPPAGAAARF